MSVKDIIAPFAIWKRAFEKPYTVAKPIDQRPGSSRYRGFHQNDLEKCIGCGTCEAICQNVSIDMVPVEGIETTKGDSGLRPLLDYGRCCWCALCIDVCPTGSLTMSNEYTWVDTDPDNYRFIPGKDEKSWNDTAEGYSKVDEYILLNKERIKMESLPVEEGLTGFMEMIKGYSKEQAIKEADRCVECGICIANCPAHMNIPAYIRAIRENKPEDALEIIYQTNPFPAACGRVCTHLCEEVCAMGKTGDAVSIRWLKRYIADQVALGEYRDHLPQIEDQSEKNIAVIGAGPGGLSAAYYLRMMGHNVEVFEAQDHGGGMLRYGIPEYRLPYDQIDKDIAYIEETGVKINFKTSVGKDIQFNNLMNDFDAVLISTGLSHAYDLGIPGDDHKRVFSGLQILKDVTDGKDPGLGKNVAVIGGGNVAMDAARTARRYGADVTILYRRREEDMPADYEEIVESKEEGINFVIQAIPMEVKDKGGDQIDFVWGKAEMVDQGPGNRPKPVLIEGDIHTLTVDSLITAVGQKPDFSFIDDSGRHDLIIDRNKIQSGEAGQTNNPKVFVGGDILNSVKDAISAIADGHRAAKGIDLFLKGEK